MPRVTRSNGNGTQLATAASMYPPTSALAMTLQRQASAELPGRPGPLLLPYVGGKVMVPTAQEVAMMRSRTASVGGGALSGAGSRGSSMPPLDDLFAAAVAAASMTSPLSGRTTGGGANGAAGAWPPGQQQSNGMYSSSVHSLTPRTSVSGGVTPGWSGMTVSTGVGTQANGGVAGVGRLSSTQLPPRPTPSPPASERQPLSPSPSPSVAKAGRTEIETQTGLQVTCEKSFYRRRLMAPAIPFSSSEGESIFQDALLAGYMRGFFKLIEQYNTQDEPAFCALASVAMVLNALSIDPRRVWKGPWRWFHEEMLDCCKPVELVKLEGMTLSQAACTAHCNGAKVDLRMHGTFTLEDFRSAVKQSCTSESEHMVICYSRKALAQTGDGHFSPIGGYNPARDMVLVLDVARFKYPPHWVPLPTLFDAMGYPDPETGKPRGYMRLSAQDKATSILFTLDLSNPDTWQAVQLFIHSSGLQWLRLLAAGLDPGSPDTDPASVLTHLVDLMPLPAVAEFVVERPRKHHDGSCTGPNGGCRTCRSGSSQAARRQLQQELRSLPIHAAVKASKRLRAHAAAIATAAAATAAPPAGAAAAMNGSSGSGSAAGSGLRFAGGASASGAAATSGLSTPSSDPNSAPASRPGSSPGFSATQVTHSSPFSAVRGNGASAGTLHAAASTSGTSPLRQSNGIGAVAGRTCVKGDGGPGSLAAWHSDRPAAAVAGRSDPETVLLKLADKVCVLLMTMLLRPATVADQAVVAASPSPRLTFPAAVITTLPSPPAPFPASSPLQASTPVASSASNTTSGGWDVLLDISSSSLVEAEVLCMIHGLGLLEDVIRQGLYTAGTSWAPCEECYSSLDCLEEGHLAMRDATDMSIGVEA